MGHIEDLAAKEVARQENNRMRAAEAARVLNQGNPGLASMAADPYVSGMSQEDIYRLAMADKAQRANEYGNIMDMINTNRTALEAKKNSRVQPDMPSASDAAFYAQDGVDVYKGYNKAMDEYRRNKAIADNYNNSIDPGLAANFMKSYKGENSPEVKRLYEQAATEEAIRQANLAATRRQSRNISPEEAEYMHEYDVGFR